MKRLINPPIQTLLWLGGMACLGYAVWSVWELRQTEEQQFAASGVKVAIPDAKELSIPTVRQYRQVVDKPLFWETRAKPKKAPPPAKPVEAAKKPEVVEVDLTPPMARLVGIIDLGKKKYALVRNEEGSQSLYKGDSWEGWTIEDINDERVLLSAGKQRTEVALIGDFAAPEANKQMLAARQRQQQRRRPQNRRQQLRQAQMKQQRQHYNRSNRPVAGQQAKSGAPGNKPSSQPGQLVQQNRKQPGAGPQAKQPAPVLSIKEALEARQRLMAARWGDKNNRQ